MLQEIFLTSEKIELSLINSLRFAAKFSDKLLILKFHRATVLLNNH